jgi:hypothetical protein
LTNTATVRTDIQHANEKRTNKREVKLENTFRRAQQATDTKLDACLDIFQKMYVKKPKQTKIFT